MYAHVAPVNRGLNWAYSMFKNRFWKYFRYWQMTSPLLNRWFTSTNIMLIWMLLWYPLTYLFQRGTRVLVCSIILTLEFFLWRLYFHVSILSRFYGKIKSAWMKSVLQYIRITFSGVCQFVSTEVHFWYSHFSGSHTLLSKPLKATWMYFSNTP